MEFNGEIVAALTDTSERKVYYYRLSEPITWPVDHSWTFSQEKSYDTTQLIRDFKILEANDDRKIRRETSIAWFAALTQQETEENEDPDPTDIMVQSMRFKETTGDFKDYFLLWELDENGMPTTAMSSERFDADQGGIAVTRDPGGRIRIYYLEKNNVHAGTMSGVMNFENNPPSFDWLAEGPLNGLDGVASRRTPVGAFMPVGATTRVQDPDNAAELIDQKVQEVVFYCRNKSDRSDRNITIQIADYGSLRKVVDAGGELNLTQATQGVPGDDNQPPAANGRWQVGGYVDGPPPFSNETLAVAGEPNFNSEVIYGTSESTGNTRSSEVELSIGMKSEGSASVGGGFAWEASFQASAASLVTTSTELTVETELVGRYGTVAGRDPNSVREVEQQGTIFMRPIIMLRDEYHFIEPGENEPAPSAPIWAIFRLQENGNTWLPVLYNVFTVTPGDLDSYSPDAWDAKMGDNYFRRKIVDNAVSLDGTGEKALNFAYGANGGVSQSTKATVSSYNERSWGFDASLYAGVKSKVDVWGVGFESTTLAGFSTSVTTSDGNTAETAWGLEVDQEFPEELDGSKNPDAPAAFAWNLYLVSASTEWTEELYDNLPEDLPLRNQIDRSSACWKIVYEVDPNSILTFGDLTNQMVERGLLSEASRKLLAENGIRTVGQLLSELDIRSLNNLDEAVEEQLRKAS